jgi:nitrite reductase/ring-hydroxylating ferredoxin subunit
MATAFRICKVEELGVGDRRIVEVAGRSLGVFNVDGQYHAIRNVCPHALAPLCRGLITGTTLPGRPGEYTYVKAGRIIRCPWHGWEFDITTGESVFNPHRVRVKAYEVSIESSTELGKADGHRVIDACDPDPSLETYPVTVEEQWIVVHV